MKAAPRSWMAVLAATLALQAIGTFLLRVPPTIAPYLTAAAGLDEAAIGPLSMINTFASILFLFAGAPLIRRFGSVRSLQLGVAAGLAGLLLFGIPHVAAISVAMFLIGLGYGPAPGAGSDILQRYAPADRRGLVFSIKQAGAPVGGMVAGFLLPPMLIGFGIWGALGCAAVIGVIVIAAVQPLRAEVDADRNRGASIGFAAMISADNLAEPFRAVTRTPALIRLALAGACFSVCQGTWFAFLVTYLVVKLGYSLALAGAVFAVTQVTGIFGRILLGWAADTIGSGQRVLALSGLASGLCSVAMALSSTQWPVWAMVALAAFAGIAVSSWNGVQMSEMVRIAPGEIHTTVAGATAIVFLGYMLGPPAFALLIAFTGRYDLGFAAIGLVGVIGGALAMARTPHQPAA